MTTYAMKDASELTFVNKRTGNIDLFLDYANATSSEWSSERVFATKKGTNAVAWDMNRTGTLTVDSEMFDLKYLALILGSEIEEGTSGVMKRAVYQVDSERRAPLEGAVDPSSINVVKLGRDLTEHVGDFLPSTLGAESLLPAQVANVTVSANDSTALISFDASARAVSYVVYRGDTVVGSPSNTSFTDTGLTPATAYEYTVVAVNAYGTGAKSAVVTATTAESGVTARTQYEATPEAVIEASTNEGELTPEATNMPTFTFSAGAVQFNDKAVEGDHYAIYYTEEVASTRKITISADKFPDSYEVYANAILREVETGADEFMQIKYFNARPQSNFTLNQDVNTPTSLSVTFDLVPDKKHNLAEYVLIG